MRYFTHKQRVTLKIFDPEAEGHEVEAALIFEKPLSYEEAMLVKGAFEKGYELGKQKASERAGV